LQTRKESHLEIFVDFSVSDSDYSAEFFVVFGAVWKREKKHNNNVVGSLGEKASKRLLIPNK
jgi:hypothetical protein